MKKKKPSAVRSVLWRLWAFGLCFWLIAIGLLTWSVAAGFQQNLCQNAAADAQLLMVDSDEDLLPGELQAEKIRNLSFPYLLIQGDSDLPFVLPSFPHNGLSSHNWLWGKWNLLYGFEAAVFYPDEKEPIGTGQYLSMPYANEERWKSGNTEPQGYLYIDISSMADAEIPHSAYPGPGWPVNLLNPQVRLRGSFQGHQFVPLSIQRKNEYAQTAEEEWETLWGDPAAPAAETVYGWDVTGSAIADQPVTFDGLRYDSLSDLLRSSCLLHDRPSLLEGIAVIYTQDGTRLALRYWPLFYATTHMIPAYLISLALCILVLVLLQNRLQKDLLRPLTRLDQALSKGTTIYPCAAWREIYNLENHFAETRQTQGESETKIQQLITALDYAREAEQKRRELISNLTHQLKNPLAVIHSYTEALQANIQTQKRDYYLGVIQEETEKMDEIVLQMLDFSRLEAGKVKLSVSQFSLPHLLETTTEHFRPLMEEKKLKLSVFAEDDLLITADEGRMEQVLSNFLSNAVKYTPEGGSIHIRLWGAEKTVHGAITNTSAPLSPEALAQIWDSFYRACATGATPGTGLGLTIVKSILKLHHGTCSVRNCHMDDGLPAVEFSFSIPVAS